MARSACPAALCHPGGLAGQHDPVEPQFQGRSLSEWLDASVYRDVAWWPGQAGTDEALRMMGTNTVPFLLRRLSYPPAAPSELKEGRHNEKAWVRPSEDSYRQERMVAFLRAVEALRPRAKEVVPLLVELGQREREVILVPLLPYLAGWAHPRRTRFLSLSENQPTPPTTYAPQRSGPSA